MIFRFLLLVCLMCFTLPSFALQKGTVQYDGVYVDYSVLNGSNMLKSADSHFGQYESSHDAKMLTTAMGEYYTVTKIYPLDLYPVVQLARAYDESGLDKLAKEYFSKALGMDKEDAYLNYYYGDFYYKREQYRRALKLFNRSYNNGYENVYDINLKIATIYEKLADLKSAKYYYNRAYSINPSASALKDKVMQIESLNYDKSDYYREKK